MVFNKSMLSYLTDDINCDFEFGPLEELVKLKEVMTYKHNGFWECADTIRDINHLNKLWDTNKAIWKVWK
jgi:glucose-1-phosphate cytidylyltransferase